jgi:hypothetical protein
LKKKSTKKSVGKTKEPAKKTKELAGKSIMIRLYPNKSQREDLNGLGQRGGPIIKW